MSGLPNVPFRRQFKFAGCKGNDDLSEARRSSGSTRLDGAQISEKSNLPESMTMTPARQSSRLVSNIFSSQISAGRDININPYNVTPTFIHVINRYEESLGTRTEKEKQVSGRRGNHVHNDDDVAAGMLIPAPTPFILERDSQRDQIIAKLLSVSNARVAVLGRGGIGKTTLACSIASDPKIVKAYPRRLFLSFEGCSTPDLAYTNLATAFHIPVDKRSSHRQILFQVLSYLIQEKTLFVVDNFETFWEISNNRRAAEEFLAQLAAQRELAIIVTLRGIQRPGNIHWLKTDPLQTLTEHASKDLLSSITDEEYPESDWICLKKLLDAVAGIPLGVALIGSLLRDESETPQSLWNHWTRERARAIRVVNEVDSDDRLYRLDLSLRISVFSPRMGDKAKAVLAAIAVLPTGMTMDEEWLDRFQNLPSRISMWDCIRTLRDVALGTLDSSVCPPRLRLLPPVRDFCLRNLPLNGDLPRRLIDIYSADLRKHWDCGSRQHYAWVTTELSNITAIIELAITLRYITDSFGHVIELYTQWRRFLCNTETDTIERALQILSEHPKAKAICLRALGRALLGLNRVKEAIQQLEKALIFQKEVGGGAELGLVFYLLGSAHYRLNDHATAEHHLIAARALFTGKNQKWMKGLVLRTLAGTYHLQNKLPEAERVGKEALELCHASGNRVEEAVILGELGRVYGDQRKYELAFETLGAAVDACRLVHNTHGEACANGLLGNLYRATNKPDQAIKHFRLAISLFEQAQDLKQADNARADLQKFRGSLNTG